MMVIMQSLLWQYKQITYKEENIMNIIINGEIKEFSKDSTLQDILNELSLEGKVMAAAVNMEIVKQDSWSTYTLNDSDKLELLDFVGGG